MICNFYRAIVGDYDSVCKWADYPTINQDLNARHKWLIQWGDEYRERLSIDPYWYDPQAAGWWVWGLSNWIGDLWCQGHDVQNRQPHIQPHSGGRGINRQNTSLDVTGSISPIDGSRLKDWFEALSRRMSGVIVLNKSWESAVTPTVMQDSVLGSTVAVFMDPPYLTSAGRHLNLYPNDIPEKSDKTALRSYEWAKQHGECYRIAYACHADDFNIPDRWTVEYKQFAGHRKAESRAQSRDCVMFSPACVDNQVSLF